MSVGLQREARAPHGVGEQALRREEEGSREGEGGGGDGAQVSVVL